MSKNSHAKHEHDVHHVEVDDSIQPDWPDKHRKIVIVIAIIFLLMSTFVFAWYYIFR